MRLTGAEAALAVNNGAAALLLAVWVAGPGPRGHRLARRAGRDRRLVPPARHPRPRRREAGRGGHHQPHPHRRLRARDHARRRRSSCASIRATSGSSASSERPSREELAALAREAKLPLVEDVGSGALVATEEFGLEHEPTVAESLTGGARRRYVQRRQIAGGTAGRPDRGPARVDRPIGRDPLARALRVDKLTIAALEATLAAYADPAIARREIPALAQLAAPAGALADIAAALARAIREALDEAASGAERSDPRARGRGRARDERGRRRSAPRGRRCPRRPCALTWTGRTASALERAPAPGPSADRRPHSRGPRPPGRTHAHVRGPDRGRAPGARRRDRGLMFIPGPPSPRKEPTLVPDQARVPRIQVVRRQDLAVVRQRHHRASSARTAAARPTSPTPSAG